MKKVLFLLLFCVYIFNAFSQGKQPYSCYCEIIGSGDFSGKKIKISFDFGSQGFSYKAEKDNMLVDDKGDTVEFSSMIDALNYMSQRGWSLQTAYSSAVKGMGAQETYRYIIKKEVTTSKEVLDGILLSGQFKKEKKKIEDDLYR